MKKRKYYPKKQKNICFFGAKKRKLLTKRQGSDRIIITVTMLTWIHVPCVQKLDEIVIKMFNEEHIMELRKKNPNAIILTDKNAITF